MRKMPHPFLYRQSLVLKTAKQGGVATEPPVSAMNVDPAKMESLNIQDDDVLRASREVVLQLMQKKDSIEAEIKELSDYLNQQNNVGMHGPLIDAEGFPRNDIDVYQVRHARHRIICLQNDHKETMSNIEQGLYSVHSEIRKSGIECLPPADEECTGDPFVRVNFVASGSPAELAGMQVGDAVVDFGSVNAKNFQSLQDVNKVVQASVNMPIRVRVLRANKSVSMHLTPKTWSGRGLLGCNIVPIESVER